MCHLTRLPYGKTLWQYCFQMIAYNLYF
uniref:Uncharacterized protein n=1 Tax=Anguilla anguilla TaxID=7936 RepID=A0A0E9QLV0_ANGAN